MNIELALRNFDTLKDLPENTRLYASIEEEISYDNRWFSGARRKIDGSSREDIFVPLNKTFIALAVTNEKSIEELIECIKHLRVRFKELYPEFEKVFTFLDYLEAFIKGFLGNNNALPSKDEMENGIELLNNILCEINIEPIKTQDIEIIETLLSDDLIKTNIPSDTEDTEKTEEIRDMDDLIKTNIPSNTEETEETEEISDMDDTYEKVESEDTEEISDMDDTMPDLVSDSETEESDANAPETPELPAIKIEVVNPLLHRGFEQYISTFESRVNNEIIPRLEQETDNMLRSIEEGVNRTTTEIRRRFVCPRIPSHKKDDTSEQYICISIPSIPNFFDLEECEERGECEECEQCDIEKLIPDDETDETDEDDETDARTDPYYEKWIKDLEEDINYTVESTTNMCRSVGQFMSKYLY